ncbi:39S ribosomal protein L47, mitochondrial-like [Mercenaria mercenaria]|uniref:39S ribosomal protein L47, mitochondrial-like n=1 Tax=Mercenaria mercenaria TaxID=6596 RepID=UPI00234FA9B1|nr:39S ribosomal protein L47, mitochondrial-like [Mercenaria mercenaria]
MLRVTFARAFPLAKNIIQLNLSTTHPLTRSLFRVQGSCSVHTSAVRCGLNEFFDDDNFDNEEIKVGRPWRKEELRIKSNQDLHKLWYVLLKERNVLLTMEHMYNEALEPLPNPERIDKVEESMENLLDVVKERNVAYHLLEEGKVDEPKKYVTRNAVGLPYERTPKEHYIPKHLNERFNLMHLEHRVWMRKYLALYEEKYRRQRNYKNRKHQKKRKELIDEFEMEEEEIPEFPDHSGDKLEEYLKQTTELKDVSRDGR